MCLCQLYTKLLALSHWQQNQIWFWFSSILLYLSKQAMKHYTHWKYLKNTYTLTYWTVCHIGLTAKSSGKEQVNLSCISSLPSAVIYYVSVVLLLSVYSIWVDVLSDIIVCIYGNKLCNLHVLCLVMC